MQDKFYKIVLIIAIIAVVLVSITYFTRTVIDIGCAKTGIPEEEGSLKRRFATVNCWFWEGTVQFQFKQNYN